MKSSIFHGHQPQVAPRDPITRDDQRPHGLGCTGKVPFEYGKPNIQICLSNFKIRKYCSVPTIIQGSMGNSRLFHWEHVDSKGPIRISAVQLETTYVRTHAWKPTCHTICMCITCNYIYIFIYTYWYIYIYICVCVFIHWNVDLRRRSLSHDIYLHLFLDVPYVLPQTYDAPPAHAWHHAILRSRPWPQEANYDEIFALRCYIFNSYICNIYIYILIVYYIYYIYICVCSCIYKNIYLYIANKSGTSWPHLSTWHPFHHFFHVPPHFFPRALSSPGGGPRSATALGRGTAALTRGGGLDADGKCWCLVIHNEDLIEIIVNTS